MENGKSILYLCSYKYKDFFDPPEVEREDSDLEGDVANSNFQVKQKKYFYIIYLDYLIKLLN